MKRRVRQINNWSHELMRKIRIFIGQESAPFVITLLFGIISWGLTHIVDRILISPVIQFEQAIVKEGSSYVVRVDLINISKDKEFSDVNFYLRLPDTLKATIDTIWTRKYPPATIEDLTELANNAGRYHIDTFQPDAHFTILARISSMENPDLMFTSGKAPLKLLRACSVEAFLLRNEYTIILFLLMICIGLIISSALMGVTN